VILERSELADKLAGQYVDVYDFADRPLEVRWKGHSLPYRVFCKDQRVSHTAVVENKRLGHALAVLKAQQDIKHQPKVRTNSDACSTHWVKRRCMNEGISRPPWVTATISTALDVAR
jgi:hypothetical protein